MSKHDFLRDFAAKGGRRAFDLSDVEVLARWLDEAAAMLKSGARLSREHRARIALLLDLIAFDVMMDRPQEGRGYAWGTWRAAFYAAALMERHGATIADALAATLAEGTSSADRERVRKALTKLRRGQGPHGVQISERIVQALARNLPHRIRRR